MSQMPHKKKCLWNAIKYRRTEMYWILNKKIQKKKRIEIIPDKSKSSGIQMKKSFHKRVVAFCIAFISFQRNWHHLWICDICEICESWKEKRETWMIGLNDSWTKYRMCFGGFRCCVHRFLLCLLTGQFKLSLIHAANMGVVWNRFLKFGCQVYGILNVVLWK